MADGRQNRVVFTRPAADRIAKVVRRVEAGDRSCQALIYERGSRGGAGGLKVATFTGTWATGTYKTVTLTGSTQTASVYNWTTPVVGGDTASTTSKRYVIFGRASGTNSAVEIQLQTTSQTCTLSLGSVDLTALTGYDGSVIQLLGHNESACLQWYSITTCSTAAS